MRLSVMLDAFAEEDSRLTATGAAALTLPAVGWAVQELLFGRSFGPTVAVWSVVAISDMEWAFCEVALCCTKSQS